MRVSARYPCHWLLAGLLGALLGGRVAVVAAAAAVQPPVLAWQSESGCRWVAVQPGEGARAGFTLLLPSRTGMAFTNVLAQERYVTNQIALNGSGVALGDVDGDGWCDVYFCGLDSANVLYRNLGDWRFEDVTVAAGLACEGLDATGAAFADLDGDGDLDLVVNSIAGGTWTYLNDGRGHFAPPAGRAPLNLQKAGMSVALADVDGDGDLDLYVANYRIDTLRDMPNTKFRVQEVDGRIEVLAMNGRPATDPDLVGRFVLTREGRIIENGEVDVLFLNDGRGSFTAAPFTGGAFLDEDGRPLRTPPYDWGLTAAFHDLNGDGAPDLYVCNDFASPDRLWINDGRGRFQAVARLSLRKTSLFSMGVDFADFNRDGHVDFMVADMLSRSHAKRMVQIGEIQPTHLALGAIDDRPAYSHNTLFVNRGDGTWAELAQFAGVHASEWSWQPLCLDVDLDGYEDILLTTGHELDMMNTDIIERAEGVKGERKMSNLELQRLRLMFGHHALPKVGFRNRGDLTFEDVSDAWGLNLPDVSNSMAVADLDNDGDLDLVANSLNHRACVFRNDTVAPRLAVRLRGRAPNTQAIGARLKVLGGPVVQTQEVVCGGRYLSAAEPTRVFAAGSEAARLTIEVTWRDGQRSVIHDARANRLYEIDQASAPAAPPVPAAAPARPPLFADVTARLGGRHREAAFDDFERQPLLPRRLSQLGPGIAWHDVNGDGWDDLFVASGRSGFLGAFTNRGDGTFAAWTDPPLNRLLARDQTAVLGTSATLIVGSSNYEDGSTNGGCVRLYDLARKVTGESLLGERASTGPLTFGDVDLDGDLDLFVGGRCLPGRYPEPADSIFVSNDAGRFAIGQRFERLGLVSGAVFSDVTGDGAPDLVLACDWGPIRVLRNERGRLVSWDAPVRIRGESSTLSQLTGWWTGVATGDLDGDGRLDLVVGNWGLNHLYRPTRAHPVRLYHGDLQESGLVDVVEAWFDPESGKEVPFRGYRAVVAALPFIQETVPTYEAYGRASVQEIYGQRLTKAGRVEANTLTSLMLLNRGEGFEAVPLPDEAQWAPAFGVCVADFDGDGFEDVFLAQNFFAVNPDAWRQDAGRGLLLRGDGRGGLTAVPGQDSGIAVYGEQRGCAVSDFDGDGRLDLAVTQNAAATCLFRNQGARPGLRVRLEGPERNPAAVGALLRLRTGARSGPAREVQAGSGYWSQNSAVQVLAAPEPATHLWIRWPGGRESVCALPADAREVAVDFAGQLRPLR